MRKPARPDQPAKTGRTGRRVLFILLSLALLGVIGLGSLQVYQQRNQDVTSEHAPGNSSTAVFDDMSSDAESNAEEAQIPSPTQEKETDPDPDSRNSETNAIESDYNSADQKPELAISGAVLDDTGILLPGIMVTASAAGTSRQVQNSTPAGARTLRQRTDQIGSFTFDKLAEGEYELAVAENEQYHPVKLRVRAGVANAELVIQRIRSVRVYGIISDKAGNPLEGVRVRALGAKPKVLSDGYGGYEIQTSPSKAGQPPVLDFSLEGYRDSRQRVEGVLGSEAADVQLDVQLEWESNAPKVAVYGLVFGPATEPVVGASVWLSSSELDFYERTRSSTMGEYRFEGVRVGDAYTIGVEPREKYAAFRFEPLSIGPGDLNYDVRLEETGFSDLSGTVTDLSGAPLGDFVLWARNTDVSRQKPMPVRTDGAGKFRLEQIPSGSIKLESRSQPWLQVTGIVLEPGESRSVKVPLDWGRRWLLGQVLDEQGEPVSRAKVVLQWTESLADLRCQSRREVMSDQGGYFALSNLDADQYTVTVHATGFAPSRIEHRMGSSEEELHVILTRVN
jgi:protocatechuate 3,4-dioxygenase beta subunit